MKSKLVTNYPSATKYLYARQRQTRRTRRTSHPPANTENKRKEWDLPIELLPASSTSLRASFALPSLHLSPPPPAFPSSWRASAGRCWVQTHTPEACGGSTLTKLFPSTIPPLSADKPCVRNQLCLPHSALSYKKSSYTLRAGASTSLTHPVAKGETEGERGRKNGERGEKRGEKRYCEKEGVNLGRGEGGRKG